MHTKTRTLFHVQRLFFSGALMAGKQYALAAVLGLSALLPMAKLLWDALLFFFERAMEILSHIGKNKGSATHIKKDRHQP